MNQVDIPPGQSASPDNSLADHRRRSGKQRLPKVSVNLFWLLGGYVAAFIAGWGGLMSVQKASNLEQVPRGTKADLAESQHRVQDANKGLTRILGTASALEIQLKALITGTDTLYDLARAEPGQHKEARDAQVGEIYKAIGSLGNLKGETLETQKLLGIDTIKGVISKVRLMPSPSSPSSEPTDK